MLHVKYWTICVAVVLGLTAAASAETDGRFSGNPAVKMLSRRPQHGIDRFVLLH